MKIKIRFCMAICMLMTAGILFHPVTILAGEKQPMPSAQFDASNLTLSQLRSGMAFSFDGGSNWSLIQDSWMNTITLTNDQVNNSLAHGILVKMTGDGNNTYDSDVLCIVLNKANTPSNVQGVMPTDTGNSGKLTNVNNSMQYKKESDSGWSDIGDTTVSNLAPGKYNVRTKGYGTTVASDSITVTINQYDPTHGLPRMATPSANFDARTMTLSGVQGVSYSLNGGNNWSMGAWDQVVLNLSDLHMDQGIKLYRAGNNTSASDSEIQTINLAKASPPTGIGAISATNHAQGTINGLSPQMEYMPQGSASWSNISTYSIQVPAGVYYVRTQGAYTTLPSDAVEVMIEVAPTPVENNTPANVTDAEDDINTVDNSKATEEVQETEAPDDFVPSTATGPSIVGNSSIRGWDAIVANMTSAPTFLNMNGTTDVPSTALEASQSNHSELVMGMEDGIIWTIQGSSVSAAKDVDLAVILNANEIPADTLSSLETDDHDYHQFRLAHEGDFGFAANLSMYIDTKDAGKYADLFYYNVDGQTMEHIDTCMIDARGNASFLLNHASAYAVTVNRVKYTGGTISTETQAGAVKEPTHISKEKGNSPWKWVITFVVIIVVCIFAIIMILHGKKRRR